MPAEDGHPGARDGAQTYRDAGVLSWATVAPVGPVTLTTTVLSDDTPQGREEFAARGSAR